MPDDVKATHIIESFDLEGLLFEKRIISIDSDIDTENTSQWISKISLLDLKCKAKKLPIILLVNSYGGDAYAALGMVDVIKNSVCPIYTVCIGTAQSAGALILAAGTKRFSTKNSRIMLHQHVNYEAELTRAEMEIVHAESERLHKQMVSIWMELTGLTKARVEKLLNKDTYLTTEEAKKLHIIDEIGWNLHTWIK